MFPEPRQCGNSFGFGAWRGTSTVMAAPHAHNDIEINFSESPLTYDSGGLTSTPPAGVPFAFWGAKPHQLVDIDPHRPLAFVTIPLARFMGWGIPLTAKNRLLQGDILMGSHLSVDGLDGLWVRWADELHLGVDQQVRASALEIEALLMRMALGEWAAPTRHSDRSSLTLKRAADMATFISANAHSDLRTSEVARTVHLHPNRAAAIFRDVFGVSISGYVGQFRVAEAQRLLLTTELSSAAVGFEAGFQSVSSYHETFSAVCGMSPTRWRQRHLAAS
ncbi:helix-turn-helix domain-containing protein [Lacisediminihabitans sp.]|uniref:helix-turn-helix domain-containing protein n=1 Tax=Lacisediminihabitans sp. TaxID=2787631 RepID=UPI00374DF6BC